MANAISTMRCVKKYTEQLFQGILKNRIRDSLLQLNTFLR